MRNLKVKYNGKYLENITMDTSLYEISKLVESDFNFPIIGAKLNHLETDLRTCVTENSVVEFFDISSNMGNEIYRRSLEFLVIVAVKELLGKDVDVLINYSLDNGICLEIQGKKINKAIIEKIEERMRELVECKLPFVKSKVSRFDAIKYFKKNNQLDKVENLGYTSNSTVDLHCLNGIYDYFFGPLAYDTGQINKFKITYLGDNSFALSYPTINNPRLVTKYKHHEKVYEKYKEYQDFGRLIDIDMVSDLNEVGALGKYNDAVNLFETHYESQLSEVADKIYKKRKNIKLVLLSGPSSSGKTTTTKKLALYLRAKGLKPHQISLDDYYVDRVKTPKDENGDYDFASLKATDVKMFNSHLERLLSGEKVKMPTFDFVQGKKIFTGNTLQLGPDDILLIEGIHTLNDELTQNINRENKFKIFVTPIVQLKIDNHNRVKTTDLRKLRRIVRDSKYRGKSAEETLKMWHNVDKEANMNIYPYQDDIDLVINTSLSYEIGVLRIYAEPLLYGIKPNSDVYSEAIRLINLLRQFMPISSEEVPKGSMLREFIGDGLFNK